MSKNELINAINNKKIIFKSKRKEIKKSFMKKPSKKILKSIIKQIKEILYDPIKNRDEQIEEIKKSSL